ncbi:conserved hypothetical protein [Theileria orientalis strain Shintoku]|uniref:Lon N-terminal domain-containing protein n=1 Tax=Theileria orientalis strain Shintoku TaxID=869250 RepID=J4D9U2_THEOR|nr:conserved hypothetical protein [Theileria orientalis strain Shintoku]BAM41600.1 conserved hypothetical protein [Theileria orientalis strain Shintoku]|eukprot:XP_009691901.1 conserved hypothetical protein [Theileria orientalis strain Shintoku]
MAQFLVFSKHIDEMMFECGICRDNLSFPSNSNLASRLQYTSGKEAENLLKKVANEAQKANLKSKLIKYNLNRIRLPIVGRVMKPETKYLQKIYYILEENNNSLNENKLTDPENQKKRIRELVEPTNITKLFTSPSVTKCVSMFPTMLSSKSPLIPGQESTIVLQEEHREYLVNEIRETNIFGIFVVFVSKYDQGSQKPEVLPNATLCEFVDLTQLDTSGRVTVRGVERFKIGNVISISDAVIQAELSLLRDSETIRNPQMTEENCRTIEKLYDKCNLLELEYRSLQNNEEDVELIRKRSKFGDKISKLIEHVDIERERNMIYELTGFAGLEYNADIETKIWACNTNNTENRLEVTIDVLKTKIKCLNDMIRETMNKINNKEKN